MNRSVYLLLVWVAACAPEPRSKYHLDRTGPWHVAFTGSFTNQITEVRVYVTGPHRDFDSYRSASEILSLKPRYASQGPGEIRRALHSLGDYSSAPAPSNMMGMTYHIFFFEPVDDQIMHFRVFAQDLSTEKRLHVYPNATGFVYSSLRVCRWLREVAGEAKAASTNDTPNQAGVPPP